MNKLWIIGIGPGHKDYILPIARQKIDEAQVVFGGKRQLTLVGNPSKCRPLKIPLEETVNAIKQALLTEQVAVIVSGDTGFYSFLDYLKQHFESDELLVYPGISSLQYMFSKLGKSYINAFMGSVHGRTLDIKSLITQYEVLGLLTDQKMTPNNIVKALKEQSVTGSIYIGENLSYEDEVIHKQSIQDYETQTYSTLCVVVIERE